MNEADESQELVPLGPAVVSDTPKVCGDLLAVADRDPAIGAWTGDQNVIEGFRRHVARMST